MEDGVGEYGFSKTKPSGNYYKMISGSISPNSNQAFIIHVIATSENGTNNFKRCAGILSVHISSKESIQKNYTSLQWISKSNLFEETDKLNFTAGSIPESGILDYFDTTGKIGIYFNELNWTIVSDNHVGAIYEYKIIDMIDNNGEEPETETYSNEGILISNPDLSIIFATDSHVMTYDNKHRVNSIIQLKRSEFERLRTNGFLIKDMMYNITDDQVETQQKIVVDNYDTFDPSIYDIKDGSITNIKADANAGFSSSETSGIIIGGKDSYTILVQDEGTGDLYFRSFINGKWSDWNKIASGNLPYVISSDNSVKDILTVTQEEYDDLLIKNKLNDETLYNIIVNGSGIISRYNEYTNLAQLGLTGTTNMQISTIVDKMTNNSVLYVPLSPTFTIDGVDNTSGILQVVKINDTDYYATVIGKGLDECSTTSRIQLYYNENGTKGNITLPQSADKFTYLRIFYMVNATSGEEYTEVYNPNGKNVHLSSVYKSNSDIINVVAETFTVNGTSIIRESGTPFYITRIEGDM